MKKTSKIINVFLIVLMLISITSNVFAAISIDNIKTTNTEADEAMTEVGSKIFTIITNAGIVISVIMLAVIGVMYMLGSPEGKAEYKKSLIPYVIGAALIFGASTIAKIATSMMKGV